MKLDRIQFRAIRWALGCRLSTPTNILLAKAREPPLAIRAQYLGRAFLSKAFTVQGHPIIPLLEELRDLEESPTFVPVRDTTPLSNCFTDVSHISHFLEEDPCPLNYTQSYDSFFYCPKVNTEKGQVLQSSPSPNREFQEMFARVMSDTVCLFMDGSRSVGETFSGFSIVIAGTQIYKQFRAWHSFSSFSLEAMAILEALQLCRKENFRKVSIFSDSLAVLKSLTSIFNPSKGSYLILLLKHILKELADTGFDIELFWIPGHNGIEGNERADLEAKTAARTGTNTQLRVCVREIKNHWKSLLYEEFSRWEIQSGEERGQFYFANYVV